MGLQNSVASTTVRVYNLTTLVLTLVQSADKASVNVGHSTSMRMVHVGLRYPQANPVSRQTGVMIHMLSVEMEPASACQEVC